VFTGNLRFSMRNKNYNLDLEGGRYVQQLNHEKPIHPIVNTITTLLLERNLMKLYEREYIDLGYRRKLSTFVSVSTNWSYARRYQLENSSGYKLVNRDHEVYTSNNPYNEELPYLGKDEYGRESGNTSFPQHEALTGSVVVQARPWLKYRIRNGHRQEVNGSSPTLKFEYRKGIPDVLGSSVDYDLIEVGFRHEFDLGVRAHIDVALRAGAFLNANQLYFMDYQHFLGNKTPLSTSDPVGNFRLLDYYRHSTSDKYFAGNVHYQFRRFLVTSIPQVRMMGVRENIFVNYLATPSSGNYTELGYSIDGILRIFRLEGAVSFQNGRFMEYGFRFGIATNLDINFSE
jgi:hypothetical protein